ncbi:sulfite exporter TauE/SafE family protein [Algibacillus agarilyticus]|uniref:sulfite exporter TauE/SafE family protein n=1 Tax=Algibacillus agarilyticus TaxID=2234133 RepID=UPI000DCFB4DB|nr:sulfite exporter TauE/SafE family protein [Algibacillus agarilyticus]
MLISLFTAFSIGFLASTHCIAMCGGIAASLGQSTTLSKIITYQLGRICTYSLLGLIVGLLGEFTLSAYSEALLLLKLLAGFLVILMGLYIARWSFLLTKFEALFVPIWRVIQPQAARSLSLNSYYHRFIAGCLWGWLPCGLVYSTLAWSATFTDSQLSPLLMLFFGLGTLPSMLLTSIFSQQILGYLKNNNVKRVSGSLLIMYGSYTIYIALLQL